MFIKRNRYSHGEIIYLPHTIDNLNNYRCRDVQLTSLVGVRKVCLSVTKKNKDTCIMHMFLQGAVVTQCSFDVVANTTKCLKLNVLFYHTVLSG